MTAAKPVVRADDLRIAAANNKRNPLLQILSGREGFKNGSITSAAFKEISGICEDSDGNLIIADSYNHAIRLYDVSKGDDTCTLATTEPNWCSFCQHCCGHWRWGP